MDMVDDAFAHIHARKQGIIDGPGTLTDKLRAVIIALPEEYTALDLQQMALLDERYPAVAARVREHLENGWEPTLALLEQGIDVYKRQGYPCHAGRVHAGVSGKILPQDLPAGHLDDRCTVLLAGPVRHRRSYHPWPHRLEDRLRHLLSLIHILSRRRCWG